MGLKITYKHDSFPKGREFALNGLGLLKNGESVEVTEDQERSFLATNGITVKEALKGNPNFKVEGSSELTTKEVSEVSKALESVSDSTAPEGGDK